MVSWKGGVALLVLLFGIAAYLFLNRPQPSPAQAAFVPCDLLNTVYVKVEGRSGAVTMERTDVRAEWQLLSPGPEPGDHGRITTLISALNSIRVLNTLQNGGSTTAEGLAQPREVVSCRTAAGASYTLSVGNRSFDGSGYYAQRGGDQRIYVISSVEVDEFDRVLAQPPVKSTPSP
ncbi:MAG: DUF4340 domain-containing protein [Candidatus Dormibacter sp.]|uniref:DUF4340 domain-containing protein n=1 Tax=Candidatus Dormibacter sp. TaxID=2973982 RepID=UPI0026D96789